MRITAKRVIGLLVVALILAACFWIFTNGRYIQDQIAVWNYEVPDEVAAIAERIELTDRGEFLYYASTPVVDGTQDFNEECGRRENEEGFNILGCYTGTTIVVFQITDERLDGMMEVTAAHELLHAVWARSDQNERDRLSALLEVEYEKLAHDPAFSERMAWYAEREPGNRANELFAILGTEVPELAEELEEVYAIYFRDRQTIITLHQHAEGVFQQLQAQTEALTAQIDSLGTEIETRKASYDNDLETYNRDVAVFNDRAQSGYFTSQSSFDQARAGLVARSDALAAEREAVNALAEQYNSAIEQLGELNETAAALQQNIDSTLAPPSGLD